MKRNLLKLASILLSSVLLFSLFSVASLVSKARPARDSTITTINDSTDAVGTFAYDGKTEILLGTYSTSAQSSDQDSSPASSQSSCQTLQLTTSTSATPCGYFENDDWKVYDLGITKKWVYLSLPYFITSVGRGITDVDNPVIKTTISAHFGADIPEAALSPLKSAFGLTAFGTKTIKTQVIPSQPGEGYNSRDIYYKNGRDRHVIKLVKEHWVSEGIGVVSTSTYYRTIDVPAVKYYFIDSLEGVKR